MTQNTLEQICLRKTKHIEAMKSLTTLADLKAKLKTVESPRGFLHALKNGTAPKLIAEVKKASPSKGLIRANFKASEIAICYERAGASCLSVLTDEPYFQGCDDYFRAVKAASNLPILRKDFMLDPYQIFESRVLGADCILLIMAALDDEIAAELYATSKELGMDVLIEVHNREELDRALKLNPEIIGVNSRNLKTLDVNIQTSHDLSAHIPNNIFKIAESGIKDYATITALQNNGYRAFLVGESLMRQDDIENAVHTLMGSTT